VTSATVTPDVTSLARVSVRGCSLRLPSETRAQRTEVPWFIDRQFPAIGKPKGSHSAPVGIGDRTSERYALGIEVDDGRVNVVAHEVDLVMIVLGGMGGQFGGGQSEDEPSGTCVN
jgi:hypothetical protein